jgi:hypothetical protein
MFVAAFTVTIAALLVLFFCAAGLADLAQR